MAGAIRAVNDRLTQVCRQVEERFAYVQGRLREHEPKLPTAQKMWGR